MATVGTRQVYGRRPHGGTVAAAAPQEKWQVDLVSFQGLEAVKGNRKHFGVLLAIDAASRKLRGTAVQSRDGPTIRAAFERLFAQGTPKVVDVDFEGAFRSPEVTELMELRGVAAQTKDPKDTGAIALIDRASGQLKGAMFRILQSRNTSVWIDKVDDALWALNERPHEAIGGGQPRRTWMATSIYATSSSRPARPSWSGTMPPTRGCGAAWRSETSSALRRRAVRVDFNVRRPGPSHLRCTRSVPSFSKAVK